jgi:putative cell wall-binding protein
MGVAAVVAAGSIVAIAPWSSASLPGDASLLTSTNGSTSIMKRGQAALVASTAIGQLQWSPDGSRAVFARTDGTLSTVRWNEGANVDPLLTGFPGIERGSPTWLGDGYGVIWSERDGPTQPWQLLFMFAGQKTDPFLVFGVDTGFNDTHPDAGSGSQIVFQRQGHSGGGPTGTPEIRYVDLDDDPGATSLVVTDGRNPALSPDGSQVAFVRNDGSNDEIFVVPTGGGTATQLTNTPTAKDHPVWSHDGAEVAFSSGSNVAVIPATGADPTAVTNVAGLTGIPAYQTQVPNDIIRLTGTNRFTTAVSISRFMWANGGADTVVLSRSDHFADALGGAALAAAKNGPLLLTPPTSFNSATRAEMIRVLGPTNKTVYILGGLGAISQSVQNQVAALGYTTVRLTGRDRYEVALAIANEISPTPELVLAATGTNFPDGLAAGAAAGSYNPFGIPAVVILTNDTNLPPAVRTYLDNLDPSTTTIFGISTKAAQAVAPYGAFSVLGQDRYDVAANVARTFFQGEFYAGIATGVNFPDALAGGAAMGTLNGPLLLTKGNTGSLNPFTRQVLDESCGSLDRGLIFSSPGVVTNTQANQAGAAISGPLLFQTFLGSSLATSRFGSTPLRGTQVLPRLDIVDGKRAQVKPIPGRT